MNDSTYIGVTTVGGSTSGKIAGGINPRITNVLPAAQPTNSPASEPRGIGVVAIKDTEMRAVIEVLGLVEETGAPNVYRGTVASAGGPADLFAARTLEQGNRSVMATLAHLKKRHNPATYVVVGIGGGINSRLAIGDVVVATRVYYYDLRREAADGVHSRVEARDAPQAIGHAVNKFFTKHHDPAFFDSPAGTFRVWPGPVGSGDAVVTHEHGWIRELLAACNELILAVDMESGGLTQFGHEEPPPPPGWLVVRGISDLADRAKSVHHQAAAAHHAAITLRDLLPYLPATLTT